MPSRQVPAWGAEERAHQVLAALGLQENPEELLSVDAKVLAEAMSTAQSSDPGSAHGVDNDVIALVDDSNEANGVLATHPMRALESGIHSDVDILFSSATHETDYWVMCRTEDFDPGSIENLVQEFAHRNRIPPSRARKIVAAYDVQGRTPVEVRGALLTDYSFTLPQVLGALAHSAAGGKAYLLSVGPAQGADAVHGTEMFGIAGQTRSGSSEEQILRDTSVRDALLALASGQTDGLWPAVTDIPTTQGLGNPPQDPTEHAVEVLRIFDGIARP